MDPSRWDELGRLFERALAAPPGAHRALLAECGADGELRAEVESLLAAYEAAPGFFSHLAHDAVEPALAALSAPAEAGAHEGRVVAHYRVHERLGSGGMGEVYRGWDVRLERWVALKFLSPELTDDPAARARLVREARAASALDHPHVCTIYGVEETPEGQTFIAMALYEGDTLRQALGRGPLPVRRAVEVTLQVAAGLAEAHARGIVHRDLKPANVMLTASGTVKLLDFGLAATAAGDDRSRPGVVMGTVAYMSPEQARGEPGGPRSDVWSLGVLLYEMLTGRQPFARSCEAETLRAVLHAEVAPVAEMRSGVPTRLAALVDAMLCRDPAARPADALRVLEALRDVQTGAAGPPLSPLRRRTAAALAGAAGLFLGLWLAVRSPGATRETGPGPATVAVLPFTVHGAPELTYLDEGLVTLLTTNLNAVGEFRGVDPRALLAYLGREGRAPPDPRRGRRVAARFGADYFVLGEVVGHGGHVRVTAALYDARRGTVAEEATVEGEGAAIFRLVDDLTGRLTAGRMERPGMRIARLAALTTHSVPALGAYLQGEREYRAGRYPAAVERFRSATEADTTFALAYYRLSTALTWTPEADRARIPAGAALRHAGRLNEADRLLVLAWAAYQRARPDEADSLARSLVEMHPEHSEAWSLLGESVFHGGPMLGRPYTDAREPFERVLSFEPDNGPAVLHLARIAAGEGRREDVAALVARGQRLGLGADQSLELEVLRASASGSREAMDEVARRLSGAPSPLVYHTAVSLAVHAGDLEGAARLAALLTGPERGSGWQAAGHLLRAELALAGGRWRSAREAVAAAGALHPAAGLEYRTVLATHPFSRSPRSELAALRAELVRASSGTHVPGLTAEAGARRPLREPRRRLLLGLIEEKLGDTAAALRTAAELDSLPLGPGVAGSEQAYGRMFAGILRAGVAANAEAGLHVLRPPAVEPDRQLPSGASHPTGLERFLRAELLWKAGRSAEAIRWLETFPDPAGYDLVLAAPAHLRRAEIHDRLGQRERAAAEYRYFLRLWARADPELRGPVVRARGRLRALEDAR